MCSAPQLFYEAGLRTIALFQLAEQFQHGIPVSDVLLGFQFQLQRTRMPAQLAGGQAVQELERFFGPMFVQKELSLCHQP